VSQLLAVNYHILIAKVLVDGTIKYIADGIVVMLARRVLVSVPHQFGNPFVTEHCVKLRFDMQILEPFPWDAETTESRFVAIWASAQILEFTCEAAASFVATIDRVGLHT
jgi:hypothetical protein